ncbi:MAG: caspase family protein [Prevotellaceae bacterium]|jgi:hypothetical protein|nr:caspase family protein [Prevotellaceae bacterium]
MKAIKLLLTIIVIAGLSIKSHSQTFHAIVFADTDDPKIGASVKRDMEKIQNEIGMIVSSTRMWLNGYYHSGREANKEQLLTVLQNLRCEPEDVVFFYYSGHGGRAVDDRSKYPQIRFKASDSEAYPMSKVDEVIAAKRPKFRIVMGDLCNSISDYLSVKSETGSGKSVVENDVYENLFKNVKGSVLVASSKSNETSIAFPDGGAFTTCFLNELGRIVSGNQQADWKVLLEKTQKATVKAANHTPVFEVNVNSGSSQSASSSTPVTGQQTNNSFLNALINMADNGGDRNQRVRSVQPVLHEYFDSPHSIVEIFGRDGKTRLVRENAQEFLERVSTSYKLINFVELDVKKTNGGKITYVKLHEIYRK